MANEHDRKKLDATTIASVASEMAEPRMSASVRKTLGTPAAATVPFHLDQGVSNRSTEEYGVVRQVYEKDGVTMYKVWVPETPNSLRWGHFVSDWAESVLELSDKLASESARLPTEVKKICLFIEWKTTLMSVHVHWISSNDWRITLLDLSQPFSAT